jgi:hypothetical protein
LRPSLSDTATTPETVPFMPLNSLVALDSGRIAGLDKERFVQVFETVDLIS